MMNEINKSLQKNYVLRLKAEREAKINKMKYEFYQQELLVNFNNK